nr:MAG TPA: hypothetical protein [Caudoviricetes sp.]
MSKLSAILSNFRLSSRACLSALPYTPVRISFAIV